MEAIMMENNNVPYLKLVGDNNAKMKKDGTVKRTHSNAIPGVTNEVYAFKSEAEIASVMNVLNMKIKNAYTPIMEKRAWRNKLIFIIGMNLGLRVSDICTLKWRFFFEERNGEYVFRKMYSIQPQKTKAKKKFVKLFFNDTIRKTIMEYLTKYPFQSADEYLFAYADGKKMTRQQFWSIIKMTAAEAGIEQNIGSHSLRKTWGYWVFHNAQDKGKALVTLQQAFNHTESLTTMRYIGLMDEEIMSAFYSVALGG